MSPTRRQILHGIGATWGIGQIELPWPDEDQVRVFVHPQQEFADTLLDPILDIGGELVYTFEHFEFVVAEIPSSQLDVLRNDPMVERVEEDEPTGIPSDWMPDVLDLFDPITAPDCEAHPAQEPSWGWERIGVADTDQDGSTVAVGILDTGIESDHCSVSVAGGRDFTRSFSNNDYEDRHGHGTHVAGIVGATDNEIGVVGVAPNADLYAVKVLDDTGSGSYSTLIAGIDWCMSEDIEIISMSLGGAEESDSLAEAIEAATAAGHLLICAAGNEGHDNSTDCEDDTMLYPATHDDVLSVVAMNEDETVAEYSSIGRGIDLLAPGTDIRSTYVDNTYAEADGTSMACPFVSGVAALRWEAHEEDGPGPNAAIAAQLLEGAEPVLRTCAEGEGLVQANPGSTRSRDDESIPGGNDLPAIDPLPVPDDIAWWAVPGAITGGVAGMYALRRYRRGDQQE